MERYKEHIKHVRFIQFVLLISCAIISMIAFFGGTDEQKAYKDLINLKNYFFDTIDSDWYFKYVRREINNSKKNVTQDGQSSRNFIFQNENDDWSTSITENEDNRDYSLYFHIESFNLSDLSSLWNDYKKSDTIQYISTPDTLYDYDIQKNSFEIVKWKNKAASGNKTSSFKLIKNCGDIVILKYLVPFADENYATFCGFNEDKLKDRNITLNEILNSETFGREDIKFILRNTIVAIYEYKSLNYSPLDKLIQDSQSNWKNLSFNENFPELTLLLEKQLNKSITTAIDIMKKIVSESGDSVDLFGTKIKPRLIREWGGLAVIIIQLVFLLHFKQLVELSRAIDPKDRHSPVVPWIGLYDNLVSKCVFLFVITVIPAATICGVIINNLIIDQENLTVYDTGWLFFLISLILTLFTLRSYIAWKKTSNNDDAVK
ncbi:MAG: hypothetical protein OEY59_12330 [Deltaproteobacteria bacterium]|nr:hypothetical protein [Deltaproteobacteria bacterium]